MKKKLMKGTIMMKGKVDEVARKLLFSKHKGLDGIIVTVGLCIIALLVCEAAEPKFTTFVETIVGSLQTKANSMLGLGA